MSLQTLPLLEGGAATVEGDHRYTLSRWWSDDARAATRRLLWCMLNPSDANATDDDPTVRKTMGFTHRMGFGGLEIVNMFSLISSDPSVVAANLACATTPRNDEVLRAAVDAAPAIMVAWGRYTGRPWVRERASEVLELLAASTEVYCLGLNGDGSPRHPLMLPYATAREEFPWEIHV